jgi:hypothetical protein
MLPEPAPRTSCSSPGLPLGPWSGQGAGSAYARVGRPRHPERRILRSASLPSQHQAIACSRTHRKSACRHGREVRASVGGLGQTAKRDHHPPLCSEPWGARLSWRGRRPGSSWPDSGRCGVGPRRRVRVVGSPRGGGRTRWFLARRHARRSGSNACFGSRRHPIAWPGRRVSGGARCRICRGSVQRDPGASWPPLHAAGPGRAAVAHEPGSPPSSGSREPPTRPRS